MSRRAHMRTGYPHGRYSKQRYIQEGMLVLAATGARARHAAEAGAGRQAQQQQPDRNGARRKRSMNAPHGGRWEMRPWRTSARWRCNWRCDEGVAAMA